MEYNFRRGRLEFGKELTEVDRRVLDFISVLENLKIKYVLVSGYVAIMFGRSRGTEDIDMFVEVMNRAKFRKFFDALRANGYWIINIDDEGDAFDFLNSKLAIRIARKGEVVPNFEIKYPKKELDFETLRKPLEVVMNKKHLLVSSLEIQIPFKFWLGTEKDVEDAVHLYELFKKNLNKKRMLNIGSGLGVKKKMSEYGVE